MRGEAKVEQGSDWGAELRQELVENINRYVIRNTTGLSSFKQFRMNLKLLIKRMITTGVVVKLVAYTRGKGFHR